MRARHILLALALVVPTVACDNTTEPSDVETRSIEDFENGMTCDSDDGAFRVQLWSDSGEIAVGRNDLILRLGFHDPADPSDPGRGIPGARIDIDAWMPAADQAMQTEPSIAYMGDGQYRIENVVLSDEGVWNFDFEVRIGENMHESISLAFEVEGI
ncbi:MAG: hypothetical protein HC927_13555 [Deltaproteobacteria bacterium]|nr:hypothetical protein [Deltaproteobacteria bacterium]